MCKLTDKNYAQEVRKQEKGSVLVELCIAIPLILFISFTGFELARSALIRLVMSDIVREATVSSYLCGFRDVHARANCFQEVISELQAIATNRFPAANVDKGLPGMLLSLEAYEVDQTFVLRDDVCPSAKNLDDNAIAALPLRRLVTIAPEFEMVKKYTLAGRPLEEQNIGNLFPNDTKQEQGFRDATCLNGSVFIAEVHLSFEPIIQIDFTRFFYGSEGSPGITNWRKEFHAVVVL